MEPGTRFGAGGPQNGSTSAQDVAAVGGWVDTTTLQKCYQMADDETMEAVVLQPRRLLHVTARKVLRGSGEG